MRRLYIEVFICTLTNRVMVFISAWSCVKFLLQRRKADRENHWRIHIVEMRIPQGSIVDPSLLIKNVCRRLWNINIINISNYCCILPILSHGFKLMLANWMWGKTDFMEFLKEIKMWHWISVELRPSKVIKFVK